MREHENDQTSAKKNRYVWKRIKHTPEKEPDPAQYERSKALTTNSTPLKAMVSVMCGILMRQDFA